MDIYKEYDNLVGKSIQGMLMLTDKDPAIALAGLDINDEDHLYVFNIAVMCAELSGKPLILNINLFKYLKLKLAYRKFKFRWGNGMFVNVNVPPFLKMLYDTQPAVGYIPYEDIYRAYYMPGKDKE